jgi:hypothetical protein
VARAVHGIGAFGPEQGGRLALLERQLAEPKAEREAPVASSGCKIADTTRALSELGASAEESSFVFSTEVLGWRTFATGATIPPPASRPGSLSPNSH